MIYNPAMQVRTTDEFNAWFSKLRDPKARAAIVSRIDRIKITGNLGDHKTLKDQVAELRINSSPGYRIYYAKRGDTIILLLNGGNKTTQRKDIEKAIKLNKNYKVVEDPDENSK